MLWKNICSNKSLLTREYIQREKSFLFIQGHSSMHMALFNIYLLIVPIFLVIVQTSHVNHKWCVKLSTQHLFLDVTQVFQDQYTQNLKHGRTPKISPSSNVSCLSSSSHFAQHCIFDQLNNCLILVTIFPFHYHHWVQIISCLNYNQDSVF